MTVKQLREWLIKQDDTGEISVKFKDAIAWRGDFQMSVTSQMNTAQFVELPDKLKAQS